MKVNLCNSAKLYLCCEVKQKKKCNSSIRSPRSGWTDDAIDKFLLECISRKRILVSTSIHLSICLSVSLEPNINPVSHFVKFPTKVRYGFFFFKFGNVYWKHTGRYESFLFEIKQDNDVSNLLK